ncbi:MAG TPA: non-ribosomal peptide synthetase, partial [Blastocatellia bacterium]|nr:non-ribosomal peptide synthetase [Blastocatellia bacterium]
ENCQLTYDDLNRRASQLAGFLGTLGIKPGMFVGISIERSLEMLVGLLGILKAGAAYVPFEPMHPKQRLAIMIQGSGTAVLLTQEKFASSLPVDGQRVICLDTDWGTIATSHDYSPVRDLPSEALCYVIYTSGSTGEPKGAMNTHRAVVSRLVWIQSEEEITKSRCFLQNSPFTFDLSALELFTPLVEGAKLVLAKPGGHRDPRYLAELIQQQTISVVHFVPSMLQAFIEENSEEKVASLKRVVCGGEPLGERLKDKFFERFGAELNNIYGPTETSIFVTVWRCKPDERVSIGSPVSDTRIHILDWNEELAPIGVPGELCVSGVGAAGGYLNRPDMTAEKFQPNPHSVTAGARLYRTGDIARFNNDGNIACLGRMDDQVKVRGFRIELGEIESALSRHQAVDSCAVLTRERATGEVSLVAYVASRLTSLAPGDLRSSLREKLPDYMVPAVFVIRESLPTNPNGKVDRRALRGLGDRDESNQSQFIPPRTPVEHTLASICNEVLGIERISIDADFFEMGGHSLSATRLVLQIDRRFQIQIPLRSVFQYPTIAGLAELIEAALLRKLQEMSEDEAQSLLRSINA